MPLAPRYALAALTSVVALPAAAVTPEAVWTDLRRLAVTTGAELSVDDSRQEGDALVKSGVAWRFSGSTDTPAMLSIDEVRLAPVGGDRVEITMSESARLLPPPEADEDVTPVIGLTQEALTITASDGDDGTRYIVRAGTIDTTLLEPVPSEGDPWDAALSLADLAADIEIGPEMPRSMSARIETGSLRLDAQSVDPAEPSLIATVVEALSLDVEGTLVAMDASDDLAAAVAAGLEIDGRLASDATQARVVLPPDATRPMGEVGVTGGPAAADLTIVDGRAAYRVETEDNVLTLRGAGLPLPELVLSIGRAMQGYDLPVTPDAPTSDFSAALRLTDVALDEASWAAFDPDGAIPRDPARLVVEASGSVRLDEAFGPDAAGAVPFETVTIEALDLTLAGASITGEGAFDIVENGAFAPAATPVGQIAFTLTGVAGLIERLSQAGIVPLQQAMGATMMIGMFTTPADAPDTLTSVIEVTPAGRIFANGQPIR